MFPRPLKRSILPYFVCCSFVIMCSGRQDVFSQTNMQQGSSTTCVTVFWLHLLQKSLTRPPKLKAPFFGITSMWFWSSGSFQMSKLVTTRSSQIISAVISHVENTITVIWHEIRLFSREEKKKKTSPKFSFWYLEFQMTHFCLCSCLLNPIKKQV